MPTAKIKSPPNIGQITLKPLDLAGRTAIHFNADATNGAVWAELLDEEGYRVPGFDKANCVPVKADSLRHRIVWTEKTLADLPSGRYHLRLHLQQAEGFAVTLE